jgi:hypothetical protein
MEMSPYIVYVTTNSNRYITVVNSSAFLTDKTGWVEIDKGYGDRFHHAQNNYFEKPIRTDGYAYRYKLERGKDKPWRECTPDEIAAQEEANRPEPVPEERSVWDELDAAYREGVDSV